MLRAAVLLPPFGGFRRSAQHRAFRPCAGACYRGLRCFPGRDLHPRVDMQLVRTRHWLMILRTCGLGVAFLLLLQSWGAGRERAKGTPDVKIVPRGPLGPRSPEISVRTGPHRKRGPGPAPTVVSQ